MIYDIVIGQCSPREIGHQLCVTIDRLVSPEREPQRARALPVARLSVVRYFVTGRSLAACDRARLLCFSSVWIQNRFSYALFPFPSYLPLFSSPAQLPSTTPPRNCVLNDGESCRRAIAHLADSY